jgi:antitoxin ParD1/3/4
VKHLSVPVSDELDEEIRKRMADGGFNSIAEYLRHAVREDLKHADQERLERLLLDGLESGDPEEVNEEWWAQRRQELEKRVRARRTKKRA